MCFNKHLVVFLTFLALPLLALGQEFLPVSDEYQCARLGDGKLHIVQQNSNGFSVFKNGSISKKYDKELDKIDHKLEVLGELKAAVKKGQFDKGDTNALLAIIRALNNGSSDKPELSTKELRLSNIENATNQLKQRKANVKVYIQSIKKCEKQKFPGLESIGATVVPIFVRGSVESGAGYLVSIPKPAANSTSVAACIRYTDVFTPFGLPPDTAAFKAVFANSICSFGVVLLGDGVLDCTGPVPAGQLSYYIQKIQFSERSPDPSSDAVKNALATLTSVGGGLALKVVPVNAAPGQDCTNLK